MWLPNTKTWLINELYYIWKGTYKRYEIERVYNEIYYKDNKRAKYYRYKAAIRRLQWFLTQSRSDISKMNWEIKKIEYKLTTIKRSSQELN